MVPIKNRNVDEAILESKSDSPTLADTYCAINITHRQTAFCLLMLGFVLAGACFVTEVMWHRYRSKGPGQTNTAL